MAPVHRDKETGQIVTNGSIFGGVLEWMRWISQIIVIPLCVALFLWGASVQKFIWKGDRYTVDMARSQHDAMEIRWTDKFEDLPPTFYVQLQESRYLELKETMRDNHDDLVKRISALEAAVRQHLGSQH